MNDCIANQTIENSTALKREDGTWVKWFDSYKESIDLSAVLHMQLVNIARITNIDNFVNVFLYTANKNENRFSQNQSEEKCQRIIIDQSYRHVCFLFWKFNEFKCKKNSFSWFKSAEVNLVYSRLLTLYIFDFFR